MGPYAPSYWLTDWGYMRQASYWLKEGAVCAVLLANEGSHMRQGTGERMGPNLLSYWLTNEGYMRQATG